MPRVRADLVMVGGKSPRQHMWEAIRAINASPNELTTYAVARKSKQDDQSVRAYFRDMAKAGIVSKVRSLPRLDAEWTLLKDQGIEAPRVTRGGKVIKLGDGAENVWRALRILGEFTAAEAAVAASINGVSISEFGAHVYLSGLAKAGYVTRRGGTAGFKPASAWSRRATPAPSTPSTSATSTRYMTQTWTRWFGVRLISR